MQSQLFIMALSAMGAAPASLPFQKPMQVFNRAVVDSLEGSILTIAPS
ncbi:hypothetical protein O9929_11285 [Vibrio lentus]|nr:hypothetical protein [Vibrio lentus]